MTTVPLTAADEAQVEEFAGNLFMACLGAMELANVELGVRLGLYEALAGTPSTPPELATAAGIAERYAQEWLEQQAVAAWCRSTTRARLRPSAATPFLRRTRTS